MVSSTIVRAAEALLHKRHLRELAKVTEQFIFITVPNEKRFVFALKYIGRGRAATWRDILWPSL